MHTRSFIAALLAAATLVPVAATAQSAQEVRHDRRHVQQDQRDVQQDQRDVHRDVRHGDFQQARHDRQQTRHDRQETRHDRQETREDWRDYRRTHRDAFRGPTYVGPRGYAYRPIGAGYRLAPAYYGRGYWVNDYARYRLGVPGAGRRWVRYGNDIVLVNVHNGRVALVHRGFFN